MTSPTSPDELPILLCVDDDITVLEALYDVLRPVVAGRAQLEQCANAADAHSLVEEALEDGLELAVVVSDEIMPDMRGHRLIASLAEFFPNIRVILLTGQAGAQDVGAAVNTGLLHAFIAKPWARRELELAVTRALDHWVERRELERSRMMQDFLLEGDPSGVVILDRADRPYAWNQAAVSAYPALAEASPELQLNHVELPSMKDRARVSPTRQSSRLTERENGRGMMQHMVFGPGPDGAWVYRMTDVTESIQTSQALERSLAEFAEQQRLDTLGMMMGTLAHDFNNVLMVLQSAAEYIDEGVEPDSPLAEDAALIQQSVSHAQGIVRQVLEFARREGPTIEVFELGEMLEKTARLLKRLPDGRLRIHVPELSRPVWIEMSRVYFEQILVNLVKNALESGDGVSVQVEVSDEDSPRLLVRDNGPGIDDAARNRLFEPFFTTKPVGRGTGLGLTTCRRLAESSGATLDCIETSPEGTVFAMSLPVVPAPLSPEEKTQPTLLGGQTLILEGCSVLVIEDEAITRQQLIRRMRRLGADKVVGIGSLRDLDRWLSTPNRLDPQLVVSDMMLPDGSWIEICELLADRMAPRPALFVSGHASAAVLDGYCAGWPRRFLAKPFGRDALRVALEELCRESHVS